MEAKLETRQIGHSIRWYGRVREDLKLLGVNDGKQNVMNRCVLTCSGSSDRSKRPKISQKKKLNNKENIE